MSRARLRQLRPALSLLLFGAALWVLHTQLGQYHYVEVAGAVRTVRTGRVMAAVVLTALNFLVLSGYDTLAIRFVGCTLAYTRIAFASFLGYAFSQALGFPLLTGVPLRFRLYSGWGLSALQVQNALAFSMISYVLGLVTLAGIVFLGAPPPIPEALHLPLHTVRPLGALFLGLTVAYVAVVSARRTPFRIGGGEVPVPGMRTTTLQILFGCFDWVLAGSVLFVLLPPAIAPSFGRFLGVFLLAQLAGVLSNVPGGIGVFEAVVLLLFPGRPHQADLLASLLLYRGIYYLLPLLVAAATLTVYEVRQQRTRVQRLVVFMGRGISYVAPGALAGMTFLAGVVLLFSGATPAAAGRLHELSRYLPVPLIELSHLLGSVAGVGLVILAWGIQRRLDAAYHLVVVLLGAGIAFSLAKGLDYEEAFVLGALLLLILPARPEFYRTASLLQEPFSPGWTSAVLVTLLTTAWLARFAFRHVEYSHELWWQFAADRQAPRTLRALFAAVATAFGFAVARLLRPARPEPGLPGPDEMAAAEAVVGREPRTLAHLALLGDKTLLFGPERRSFLMYAVEGRSWVAMGDPVGEDADRTELAWRFREMADRHAGWPVFYQVRPETLPLYLDLGLALLKLGEEARVPLERFTLKGAHFKKMRQTLRRMEEDGFALEIVPPEHVPERIPELRRISDAWLRTRNTREKKFSLGFFHATYLARTPVAIVCRGRHAVAFANLWTTTSRTESSIDLMRHALDAPRGIMDFLLVRLMLRARDEGVEWFNLGMAPLSGLESRPLAPLWSRLGATVFQYGEYFYNFQGLRDYKEKFQPVWEPRYLASPGGLSLPRVLTNVATLISSGIGGVVSR